MPKAAAQRVAWDESSAKYQISEAKTWGMAYPDITFEGQEWQQWLERIPSFHFQGRSGGHFTARKETRARGGAYWIVYRRVYGKLIKRYLGPPGDVTIARLEQVAGELGGADSEDLAGCTGPGPGPGPG